MGTPQTRQLFIFVLLAQGAALRRVDTFRTRDNMEKVPRAAKNGAGLLRVSSIR